MKHLLAEPSYSRAAAPFLQLTTTYISGALFSYPQRSDFTYYVLTLCFGLLFCLLLFLNLYYKKLNAGRFKGLNGLLMLSLSFNAGALCTVSNDERLFTDYYANMPSEQLKLRINEEPQMKNGILTFKAKVIRCYLKSRSRASSGHLLVSIKPDSPSLLNLKYGQELIATANYAPVSSPPNPQQFNYKEWLAHQNIHHQSFLRQSEVIPLSQYSGHPIIAFALALRREQVDYYQSLIKDKTAFSIASTLILGYRSDLDAETLEVYSHTGTIHVLSVSGMHVGLIYLVLNWLLRLLDSKKVWKYCKFILVLGLIWSYTILSGCSPSVLRSAIMISVWIATRTFALSDNSYNTVAFTAFAMLVYDPNLLWDLGFQLSFLAVLGLIWIQPILKNCWHPRYRWLSKLWATIAMSIAAQLATFPFSVYYFHQFPVYFLLSNLFIMIPSALIMYLGITILIFRIDHLVPTFEWLIHGMNIGLRLISKLPMASWSGIWIDQLELILLHFCIAAVLLVLANPSKQRRTSAWIFILLLQVKFCLAELQAQTQKEIILFSIRKHYAIAFISGRAAIVYTDLSNQSRDFELRVQPSLDARMIENTRLLDGRTDTIAANFSLQQGKFTFYQYQFEQQSLKQGIPKLKKALSLYP